MILRELIARPSRLALTVACPASLQLEASVPLLPETEEEAEGTAAHWIAMRYASGYHMQHPVGSKFISNGREWEVDLDMVVGAVMYTRALGGPHNDLRLEDGVTIKEIHPTHCRGTPDAFRYFPNYVFPEGTPNVPAHAVRLVRLGDYKFGHRFVEVYGCYQLLSYLSGVLDRLQLDERDEYLWAELVLVQPRSYHRDGPVRVWRFQISEMRAWLNHAMSAVREALEPNPRAITNDSCTDCKARHVCVVKQRCAQALIDFSGVAEVVELPPEALGQELALVQDAIKRLEARETGLKAQAEVFARQGKPVAFYHMEAGGSYLIYKDDVNVDEVVDLGDVLGIDLRKERTKKATLVTPTQAIQLGIDAGVMAKYSHRPPASMKLTRDNSITASKVFSK